MLSKKAKTLMRRMGRMLASKWASSDTILASASHKSWVRDITIMRDITYFGLIRGQNIGCLSSL